MYKYILCFCGRSIGEYVAIYDAYKSDHAPVGAVDDARITQFNQDYSNTMKPLLDALGFSICCRARITTQCTMVDIVNR